MEIIKYLGVYLICKVAILFGLMLVLLYIKKSILRCLQCNFST